MLEELKRAVREANALLPKYGLVTFTWGNVSGIDRVSGLVFIKPSVVPYEELTDEELKYARNEIVARYGRKFKTPELAAYFGAKTWYHPTYEPEEFDKKMDSLINAFEKANVNLINKIEAERAAQKKQ